MNPGEPTLDRYEGGLKQEKFSRVKPWSTNRLKAQTSLLFLDQLSSPRSRPTPRSANRVPSQLSLYLIALSLCRMFG